MVRLLQRQQEPEGEQSSEHKPALVHSLMVGFAAFWEGGMLIWMNRPLKDK